jgi:ABC-type multidrug transport system fused ATPase/permease subunit
MISIIKKLLYLFDKRTKWQLVLLFGLMLLVAILEIVGIGIIIPVISVIADPELVEKNKWLRFANDFTGAKTKNIFLLYLCLGLVLFFFVKSICIGVMNYFQLRFIFSKRSALGAIIFRLHLSSPYTLHLERNTAEFDRNLRFDIPGVFALVRSFILLSTQLCLLVSIAILLLIVNPILTFFTFLFLGVVSIVLYKFVGQYSKELGERVQSTQTLVAQSVLEGYGSVKEVKVSNSIDFFPNRYYHHMMENAQANWRQATLSSTPKLFMEVVAVGSIALVVGILLIFQEQQVKSILPILSLLGLSMIKLMPSLAQIITNLQQIRFNSPSVDAIYKEIQDLSKFSIVEPEKNDSLWKQPLFAGIHFQNIGYSYPNSNEQALKEVSLSISRGKSVAFVGSSGAGKTTLAGVLLGLLEPTTGKILLDEKNVLNNLSEWQKKIGFVPQSIYLLDASIRNNIAFGLEDENIDDSKVWDALKVAQLDEFVRQLPEGINSFIGENGVRFSGGQRQRIGIARALYHQPEILILDEATSALDSETEKEVSKAIEDLSGRKTLIIIAHRLSTIKKCDCVYFMQKGTIVDSGTFEELTSKNPNFERMADLDTVSAS